MAYDITLKKCISPVNKFDKMFVDEGLLLSCVMKDETDVFRPTFVIQTDNKLWNYNYIDGSSFTGRQYFIINIRSIGYNRYEVDAKTDVLSTWKSQIRSNSAVIKRQEKRYNLYLNDPDFHVYNNDNIVTKEFSQSEFDKDLNYILVINGS